MKIHEICILLLKIYKNIESTETVLQKANKSMSSNLCADLDEPL